MQSQRTESGIYLRNRKQAGPFGLNQLSDFKKNETLSPIPLPYMPEFIRDDLNAIILSPSPSQKSLELHGRTSQSNSRTNKGKLERFNIKIPEMSEVLTLEIHSNFEDQTVGSLR
jgi:hypothetical protein